MSHPQITLPLLWQAVQDLKHEPNRQGQPLGLLIPEALNELELCAYHLNPAPSISKEEFTALQVGEHVYAQLSSPITKAYASRKLVPFGRAAISITRNRNKALAVERLSEFIRVVAHPGHSTLPFRDQSRRAVKVLDHSGYPRTVD
jgi:hypothetical protein